MYTVVTVAVAALGVWLGSLLHKPTTNTPTVENSALDTLTLRQWRAWHDSLAQAFHDEVVDIEVGRMFPPLVISPFDADSSLTLSQILPHGGIVALVTADCDKCVQTAVALQAAVDSAGVAALPAVLLADAPEGAVAFAGQLAVRGVRIPMYCDRETALRIRHNVRGTMPWFRLDSKARLVSYGFVLEPNVTTLREIASEDDSAPGGRQK